MTVILVTQQIGSRGDEVASGIAARLGFELVHRERMEQRVAERLQISKCTVHRLLEGDATLVERWKIGPHRAMRYMGEEVAGLAARGNAVVQSWGATTVLRSVRNVICVHICAPARRPPTTPAGMSRVMDAWRPSKLRRWLFARNCEGIECYDLVLNTERMPVDECVEQVRRVAQSPNFQPTAASHAMLANFGQEGYNNSLLIAHLCARRSAPILEVYVGSDTIRLPQEMTSEEAIARVEQHLGGRGDRAALAAFRSAPPIQRSIL